MLGIFPHVAIYIYRIWIQVHHSIHLPSFKLIWLALSSSAQRFSSLWVSFRIYYTLPHGCNDVITYYNIILCRCIMGLHYGTSERSMPFKVRAIANIWHATTYSMRFNTYFPLLEWYTATASYLQLQLTSREASRGLPSYGGSSEQSWSVSLVSSSSSSPVEHQVRDVCIIANMQKIRGVKFKRKWGHLSIIVLSTIYNIRLCHSGQCVWTLRM